MQPITASTDQRIAQWRQRVWDHVHMARLRQDFVAASISQMRLDHGDPAVQGWQKLQQGQIDDARRCFQAALHDDPYALGAWLGLSRTAVTLDDRRQYLQTAIDLHFFLQMIERAPT